MPLHINPAPAFTITWTARCDTCDDPAASWGANQRGTGARRSRVYHCPTCTPDRALFI